MKSPSSALVWELWQKNRWGFALLALLLGICAGLSHYVSWLKTQEQRFWANLPLTVQGSLSGTNVLVIFPTRESAPPRDAPPTAPDALHLLEMKKRYGLPLRPGEESLLRPRTRPPVGPPQTVRFELGSVTIYDGLFRPEDVLAWSSVPGKDGVLRFKLNRSSLYEGPLDTQPRHAVQKDGPTLQLSGPGLSDQTNAEDNPAPSAVDTNVMGRRYGLFPLPEEDEYHRRLIWTRADGVSGSFSILLLREAPPELFELANRWAMWRQAARGWSTGLLAFSFLALCAIFALAEPHAARGFSGLPPRRFTLPVRTFDLVVWPIGLGVLTVWVLYGAWAWLVFPPLLAKGVPAHHLFVATLLAAGLVLFQALVWGLPSFPKLRATLITVLVLVLIASVFAALATFESGSVLDDSEGRERGATLLFALLVVAAALVAWFGVRQERRGRWASWRGWGADGFVPVALRARADEFGAALRAQFWIEWRRNARLPLYLWVSTTAVLVGLALLARSGMPQPTFTEGILGAFALLVPPWIAIAGLNLARDGGTRQLALSPFSASRPVPTESLLKAKLLAGGALWLCAAGVAVLAALILHAAEVLPRWPDALPTLMILALSLHLFTGILPLCLSGRIPGFPWSLAPLILVYGVALNAFLWFDQHSEDGSILFGLLVTLVVAKLVVSYWGFRRSLGLKLVSPRFVAGYTGFWLVGTGMLAVVAWRYAYSVSWEVGSLSLIPGALLVVPLARIAVSPLALALNRHR